MTGMKRGIMLAITGCALGYVCGAAISLDAKSFAHECAVLCVCVVYLWRAVSALERD